MKQPNYPSPCLNCERNKRCERTSLHMYCREWQTWWFWWWKYFQQNIGRDEPESKTSDKFRYEHPDIVRMELKKNPCDNCFRKEICANPCYKYLAWYNAWVETARRRLGI